jgi:hypothetical protein
MSNALVLTRSQILGHRRRVGALEERLPWGKRSLRRAAWAGLQDSMPRAALLSIHARLHGAVPEAWEDPSLVQLWGPRFSAYVVAERDLPIFSLGRLAEGGERRRRAEDLAARLAEHLDDDRLPYGNAARALGVHHNELRYAAPTGTVLIRWDGARQPTIWTVPAPDMDPRDARRELVRRFLHVFGPSTSDAFAAWAGITPRAGVAAFDALRRSLTAVQTPLGPSWILSRDEGSFRSAAGPVAPARLLPSGDAYFLLWGAERELLVADADRRDALWTSRVWPGAVLVEGEIVGTWRRARHAVSVQAWQRLSPTEQDSIASEAATMPLPDLDRPITIDLDQPR